MKAIINNRKYDTETAEKVGYYDNGYSYRDFFEEEETLYRKKTGEFFLHCCGGPNTQYARRTGTNSWGWGEVITPMTEAEAREWAMEHIDVDSFEAIFGEVEE